MPHHHIQRNHTHYTNRQPAALPPSHRLVAISLAGPACCRPAPTVACCTNNSNNTGSGGESQAASNVASSSTNSSDTNTTPATDRDNPLALAFLGDAIWTLYVRRHFFYPPKHYSSYHAAVRPFITAEGQAGIYDSLLLRKQFTPDEVAFLRRARAWEDVKLRKRFATPAAADTYRKATALEALVGHLHRHDPQRLEALVAAALPPPASPMQALKQDDS